MTPESKYDQPSTPEELAAPGPAQAAKSSAITIKALRKEIQNALLRGAKDALKNKNLRQELNLTVSPTVKEIYDGWDEKYRTCFNDLLFKVVESDTGTLTPEQERITDLVFDLTDCEYRGSLLADTDIAKAYLAAALELRAYYECEDDEDEGPIWCKKKHCAS